jgi:hypothetical protein
VGSKLIDNLAHSAKFFITFPALHRGVFFTLVVGEYAVTDLRRECFRRHEHACLHHEVGKAKAPQERRFAAGICARDDDNVFMIGIEVVANNLLSCSTPRTHRTSRKATAFVRRLAQGWEGTSARNLL